MAIVLTHLDGGAAPGGNPSSYTTNSISPAANCLVLISIQNTKNGAGAANQPTVTGASLTWTADTNANGYSGNTQLTILRAWTGSSPGSGALTIDFAAMGMGESNYSIDQFANVKVGGINGANAIAQRAVGSTTSMNTLFNASLGAFANPNDVAYGCEGGDSSSFPTKGSSFTQLTPSSGQEFMAEWAVNQPTVAFTSPNGGNIHVSCAVEIAIADSGGALFYSYI
jgi:hypothetical protein